MLNSKRRILNSSDINLPEAKQFIGANERLAMMYEDFITEIVKSTDDIASMKYLDFACNAGYFPYRLAQLGCLQSCGIDAGDFHPAFKFVADVTGINAEFTQDSYDFSQHKLQQTVVAEKSFDFVSNVAFMCHSSDPQFLLSYLASLTNKGLLIFSMFPSSPAYQISYSTLTSQYFGGRFPVCFDATTAMSDSLLRFGLKELGFSTVTEIPRRPYWLFDDNWRCFLALR